MQPGDDARTEDTAPRGTTTTTWSVSIDGGRPVTLPRDHRAVEGSELRTGTYSIDCASGERDTGEWLGVRVGALLERATVDGDATHLLVIGADGYRVCIPLADSLDALLAVDRLDAPADGSLPRFVGAGIVGTRSVARVRCLETVALDPGEPRDRYERLAGTDTSPQDPIGE